MITVRVLRGSLPLCCGRRPGHKIFREIYVLRFIRFKLLKVVILWHITPVKKRLSILVIFSIYLKFISRLIPQKVLCVADQFSEVQ